MAIDVTVDIEISRPRDEVVAFTLEPSNDPAWIGGVVDSEKLTDGPMELGARVRRTAKFLGRCIDYVTEVVEYDPGRLLVMRAIEGPFAMIVSYGFEDAGEGTRVSVRNQGEATGFFKLAAPLLAKAMKRSVGGDVKRLKKILESA